MTAHAHQLPLTYILPLKATAPRIDLADYLQEVSGWVAQVVVVDGSDSDVVAAHAHAWPDQVQHVAVDPDLTYRFGKVNGVLTGLRRARCDAVVIADDDVRYTRHQLREVARRLATAEAVVPANYFCELPWHARWDTARTLINRAFGRHYPGTLGVRRAVLAATEGYDGDVLFENLELLRTVRAAGGTVTAAPDVLVARQPPSTRHFPTQRVRQAYDSFAQPWRQAAELSLLPAITLTARRWGLRGCGTVAAAAIALAEVGRRRAAGRATFPASTTPFALAWIAERGVCAWLAVGCRLVRGGVVPRGGGATTRRNPSTDPRPTSRPPAGGAPMEKPDTGTPDHVYDLIVTLQRALEDAWRFAHFADDADVANDNELADFFRELAESDRDIAAKCQRLLDTRRTDPG